MALDYERMMKEALREAEQKLNSKEASIPKFSFFPIDLGEHQVILQANQSNPSMHYVSNFLEQEECNTLLQHLYSKNSNWIDLGYRKLLNHGGVAHLSGTILEPLPPIVRNLVDKLVDSNILSSSQSPNQSLINEYVSTGKIGFHNDGPNFKPLATIISLNKFCFLEFTVDSEQNEEQKTEFCIFLEPNSCFRFTSDAYNLYKHGVFMKRFSASTEENKDLTEGMIVNWDLISETSREKLRRYFEGDKTLREIFEKDETGKNRVSITLRQVAKVKYKMDSMNEVLPGDMEAERKRRLAWWTKAINDKK
eukprot:snap_masked-scaffold_13-processed-gene-6.28-mRNA-1 protein AED:1.00 eAED:1.00 QI:0/-1/0/0/-1/1/1/0/307